MNPLCRQLAIRDFELFVSSGVHEVPEPVFERETRAAGEYRVVRASMEDEFPEAYHYPSVNLGTVLVDTKTGNILPESKASHL